MRWSIVAAIVVAACACGAPADAPLARPARVDAPEPLAPPRTSERHYAIWLGGAQVGTARETEQWSPAGVVVRRTEDMRFRRGDVLVTLATAIEIAADRRLAPSRVTWTETGQVVRHGHAIRDATGWTVDDGSGSGTGARRLPRDAVPAELVPLLVRRDGRFTGAIFLPARGFVAGTGRIDPIAPGRLIARLVLDGDGDGRAAIAAAEATIDLADDAMPSRVVDGDGVIATRISAAQAERAFEPVDLIAATAIPLSGSPSGAPAARLVALQLDGLGDSLAIPPIPGQARHPASSRTSPGTAIIELSPRLPGELPPGPRGPERTATIAALVAQVHDRIVPDLAANPIAARSATTARSGDCTAYALAYAALAAGHAIPTLVVTGYRIDGDRLIRHRWAVSWTGRTWIAVDAAFGAAPAGGDLVGLAIHDADDAGLVAGEAALTRLRAASWQ